MDGKAELHAVIAWTGKLLSGAAPLSSNSVRVKRPC